MYYAYTLMAKFQKLMVQQNSTRLKKFGFLSYLTQYSEKISKILFLPFITSILIGSSLLFAGMFIPREKLAIWPVSDDDANSIFEKTTDRMSHINRSCVEWSHFFTCDISRENEFSFSFKSYEKKILQKMKNGNTPIKVI